MLAFICKMQMKLYSGEFKYILKVLKKSSISFLILIDCLRSPYTPSSSPPSQELIIHHTARGEINSQLWRWRQMKHFILITETRAPSSRPHPPDRITPVVAYFQKLLFSFLPFSPHIHIHVNEHNTT